MITMSSNLPEIRQVTLCVCIYTHLFLCIYVILLIYAHICYICAYTNINICKYIYIKIHTWVFFPQLQEGKKTFGKVSTFAVVKGRKLTFISSAVTS